MEYLIDIEFVPPNNEVKHAICENFSEFKKGDPEDYLDQYKKIQNILDDNYLFETIFFNHSEVILNINSIECNSSIKINTVSNDDIDAFISIFGTFLLDIDCELVSIKAKGSNNTLVGYIDGDVVEVVEEGELENVSENKNADWVDDALYKGVDDIFKGITTHGDQFGFNDKLIFFLYNDESTVPVHPVNKNPAHWYGQFSYFNRHKNKWIKGIEYEVFIQNIEIELERIIHFKCGDISISSSPPLCVVPDKDGVLTNYSINQTRPGTYLMDNEIERILKEAGVLIFE